MSSRCRLHLQSTVACEGQLSLRHGFMPPTLTGPALPGSHRAWDDAAAALPAWFASNRTQQRLAALPPLPADASALPDEHLARAGVVLGALGHAYWRFGSLRFFPRRITQVPTELPPSILQPWRTVCARLGRHARLQPFQNFYDLFLANYRYRDGVAPGAPRIIENLDVLVPSFRNEAERVFYLSFVEMHVHFTPIVAALCDLEDAVGADDPQAAAVALAVIAQSFRQATTVWQKISARSGAAVYCDPVLWSKTVAILGVPPEGTVQGATSGACSPVLYVMDALLEREGYESHYGRFMRDSARHLVAPTVHAFAACVRGIGVAAFMRRHVGRGDGGALHDAWHAMTDAYAGEDGWLGRHASKVFNYLCISTITGRNASVSGHERYFGRQTWIEASEELKESRRERLTATGGCPVHAGGQAAAAPPPGLPLPAAAAPLPAFTWLQVARHHREGDLWIVIDGGVYDVSRYADVHPGGRALLQAYAAQDVTGVFWSQRVHHGPGVARLLAARCIGRIEPEPQWHAHPLPFRALHMLLRCRQALRMQLDHGMEGQPALKLFSDENAHMMLLDENLPAAFDVLQPGVWAQRVAAQPAARAVLARAQAWSVARDYSDMPRAALLACAEARCGQIRRHDLPLADAVLDVAIDVIAGLPPAAGASGAPAAADALLHALAAVLDGYFRRMAEDERREPPPHAPQEAAPAST